MRRFKILIILLLMLTLGGCQSMIETAQSWIRPMALSEDEEAFRDFLMDDILILSGFIDVVNDITYQVMPSVVEVNFEVRYITDLLTTTTIKGSGIIIEQDLSNSYAITSSDFYNNDSNVITNLIIKNSKGKTTTGHVVYVDHDMHLMLIRFISFDDPVTYLPTLSKHQPKENAPYFMVGLKQNIQFGMTMGLILSAELDVFHVDIDIDQINPGNIILNLSGDILGMYTTFDLESETWRIAYISDIETFLESQSETPSEEVS